MQIYEKNSIIQYRVPGGPENGKYLCAVRNLFGAVYFSFSGFGESVSAKAINF